MTPISPSRILGSPSWSFLSGFIVPIALFPESLRGPIVALPFAATLQAPINIFLEKHSGTELVGALVLQAMWALALLLAGRWILSIATRRLVTQGG